MLTIPPKKNLFIFLLFIIFMLTGTARAEVKQNVNFINKAATEESKSFPEELHNLAVTITGDILSKLSDEIDNALERTLVLTIPDEKGYVSVEAIKAYAENNAKYKNMISLKHINRDLEKLFKNKQYDIVVLNVGENVSYQYLYNVIFIFEKFIVDRKINQDKEFAVKYLFSYPVESKNNNEKSKDK